MRMVVILAAPHEQAYQRNESWKQAHRSSEYEVRNGVPRWPRNWTTKGTSSTSCTLSVLGGDRSAPR
jgi:hypothetical protein